METLYIVLLILACTTMGSLIGVVWAYFELSQERKRLKDSNDFFRFSLDDKIEENKHLGKRIEVLYKSNNRYKAKLHRRETRIKNLLTKIEQAGL